MWLCLMKGWGQEVSEPGLGGASVRKCCVGFSRLLYSSMIPCVLLQVVAVILLIIFQHRMEALQHCGFYVY